MNITVPHADTVGHDPLEAAKPLLLLGWTAPAALVARVALERCAQTTAANAGIVLRDIRPTVGKLLVGLDRHGVIHNRAADGMLRTASRLSEVAHGESLPMLAVVELIEAVERHIGELRHFAARGGGNLRNRTTTSLETVLSAVSL